MKLGKLLGLALLLPAGCLSTPPADNPLMLRPAAGLVENPVLVRPGQPSSNAYADVFDPMVEVMAKAKAKYGHAYNLAGGDGVHHNQEDVGGVRRDRPPPLAPLLDPIGRLGERREGRKRTGEYRRTVKDGAPEGGPVPLQEFQMGLFASLPARNGFKGVDVPADQLCERRCAVPQASQRRWIFERDFAVPRPAQGCGAVGKCPASRCRIVPLRRSRTMAG